MGTAKQHEAMLASSFRRLARPAGRLASAGLASAVSASLLFAGGAQAAALFGFGRFHGHEHRSDHHVR